MFSNKSNKPIAFDRTAKVAVNGITRSGTNLVASLIAAQNKWICTDASLPELQAVMAFCPKINRKKLEIVGRKEVDQINRQIDKFLEKCIGHARKVVFPNEQTIRDQYHTSFEQYYGISTREWMVYFSRFYGVKKLPEFSRLYEEFGVLQGLQVIASRITGATPYAKCFLDRGEDHYWIEITRNPYARFYSAKRAHALLAEDSFFFSRNQIDYIEKMQETCDERFLVVRYEDLVTDVQFSISRIFKFLDIGVQTISAQGVTPEMKTSFGNSSDNDSLFMQHGKREPVYTTSIYSYKGNLTAYEIAVGASFGFREEKVGALLIFQVHLVKIYLHMVRMFEWLLVFLGKAIRGSAIIVGYAKYIFRKKYPFKATFNRIYSDQNKTILRGKLWKKL